MMTKQGIINTILMELGVGTFILLAGVNGKLNTFPNCNFGGFFTKHVNISIK